MKQAGEASKLVLNSAVGGTGNIKGRAGLKALLSNFTSVSCTPG